MKKIIFYFFFILKTQKFLTLFLYLFVTIIGYCQDEDNSIQNIDNIVPPSPTAYELGKYGAIELDNPYGAVTQQISLIEYKTKNLTVPISLSYFSNGIKVNEMSTNVGIGWSLNIGGMISRVARGHADEVHKIDIIDPSDFNSFDEYNTFLYTYLTTGAETLIDIFSYNFLGHTGRFVLDNDNKPIILKPDGLNIEIEIGAGTLGVSRFTITDEEGIVYQFSDIEQVHSNNESIASDVTRSAWYLSKIVHPYGDEIYFQYDNLDYTYELSVNQNLKASPTFLSCLYTNGGNYVSNNPFYEIFPDITQKPSNTIYTKRLQSISSNSDTSGSILLNYITKSIYNKNISNIDVDMFVERIELKDEVSVNSKIIEEVNFEYFNTLNKRTFLKKIWFQDVEKSYEFDYVEPENFPNRLSFSQDHWGYYNGRNNTTVYSFPDPVQYGYENYFGSSIRGSNKELDAEKAQYGLLKKVIYPTKGYTEFKYESNDYWGEVTMQPNIEKKSIIFPSSGNPSFLDWFETNEIQTNQNAIISGRLSIDQTDQYCVWPFLPGCDIGDDPYLVATIKNITDLTEFVVEVHYINDGGSFFDFEELIPLVQGHKYSIKLSTDCDCLYARVDFEYFDGQEIIEEQNILQGGSRIETQITKANVDSAEEINHYYYGTLDNLEKSTGFESKPRYIYNITEEGGCQVSCCGLLSNNLKVLSGNSLINLYRNSMDNSVAYESIILSKGGDNFENGGIINEYKSVISNPSSPIHQSLPIEGWGNGLLLSTSTFKKNEQDFITLQTQINQYERNNNFNEIARGIAYRYTGVHRNGDETDTRNLDFLTKSYEFASQHRVELKYKTNIIYDENGENPLIINESFKYDNDHHLKPTYKSVSTSEGNDIITIIQYPHDTSGSPCATDLISEGRTGTPLIIIKEKGSNTLSIVENQYECDNDTATPKYIFERLGNSSLDNTLPSEDLKVTYLHDNNNNLIQYTKSNDIPVTFIWGYNKTKLIAKIENVTSSQVTSAFNSISNTNYNTLEKLQILSNNDDDRTQGYLDDEGKLREALDALRNALSEDAQMTSFTYDPLIGVTSITDPRGETIYYNYDSFNRLESVKDTNGHVLSKTEYNYNTTSN